MSIMLLGPNGIIPIKEHRLSVAVSKTCYRGTVNDENHPDCPPRTTYKEALTDAEKLGKNLTAEQGGMCMFSLACHPPRKVLAGTEY